MIIKKLMLIQERLLPFGQRFCNKCQQVKTFQDFRKSKDKKSGFCSHCKTCSNEKGKTWYTKNKIKRNAQILKYREDNPERWKEYGRNWAKSQRKTNIQFKLKSNLRRRTRELIQTKSKGGRSEELLGCKTEQFIKHIESLFQPGMTWENWGKGLNKWNLDHILCCELFDLTDERQQKICFHYSNIRPVWAKENYTKRDFLPDGRTARDLSAQEKLDYLKTKGFDFPPAPQTITRREKTSLYTSQWQSA